MLFFIELSVGLRAPSKLCERHGPGPRKRSNPETVRHSPSRDGVLSNALSAAAPGCFGFAPRNDDRDLRVKPAGRNDEGYFTPQISR
jgi:hypothetical protein